MTNVFCVRAEFGTYTQHFLNGKYAAIGWLPNNDLSSVATKEEIYPLYKAAYPNPSLTPQFKTALQSVTY